MQVSIKNVGPLFITLVLSTVFYLDSVADKDQKRPVNRSIAGGKMITNKMASLSATSEFVWINQSEGRGKVRVTLLGRSFSDVNYRFKWILPETVKSNEVLESDLDEIALNTEKNLEIEVAGLESNLNQNIVFQLKATGGQSAGLSVVVPTNFEKTLEGQVASHQRRQELELSLKSKSSRGRLPAGIQF